MGTRSITVVTGPHSQDKTRKETIRLYQSWDGSPDMMLANIAAGIALTAPILARWQSLWRSIQPEVQSVPAKCMADAVLAASLGIYGMSMRQDDKDGRPAAFQGPPAAQAFGDQGDLEWVYFMDVDAKTVHVYGGYGLAQDIMKNRPTAPMLYLEAIRDEYQVEIGECIQAGLAAIRKAGWKINPIP